MLVPELLIMTGLTDEMRTDGKLMRAVAEYTKLTPDEKMNTIMD